MIANEKWISIILTQKQYKPNIAMKYINSQSQNLEYVCVFDARFVNIINKKYYVILIRVSKVVVKKVY